MNSAFLNSIIRSSTDFKFYKEVFNQTFGKSLRYLLLLAVLVTLILGIRYGIGLKKFSKEIFDWMEQNAPYVEITDGVVKADVSQPFISGKEDFAMIIDTTGQITRIDKKYKTGVLLTKDKLIVKQDEVRTQEFDLGKVKSFKLDKTAFGNMRKFFGFVLIPFMIIVQFIYFFISKIVQALLAGLVVNILRPGVKYSNILNICIYALTPVTLLAIVVTFISPRPVPFFWLIYIGMYTAFVIGGVKQCLAEQKVQ